MVEKTNRFLYIYALLSCFFVVLLLLLAQNRALLAEVEAFVKERTLLAVLFLLSVYVLRAFVPFLSLFLLYTLTSRVLPYRLSAFCLNVVGTLLLHTLAYAMGRFQRRKRSPSLNRPYSKKRRWALYRLYRLYRERFRQRTARALEKGAFKSLLIFTLSPYPKVFFGRICGGEGVAYPAFILAALIGSLPRMASATLLGRSLSDPATPMFGVSLVLTIAVTVFSARMLLKSTYKENP